MADRIGIIHQGRLIAVGTREELRQQSGASGPLEQTFLALTAEEKETPPEAAKSVEPARV
jgi:ABC-2 type transport system ATP-binding protein